MRTRSAGGRSVVAGPRELVHGSTNRGQANVTPNAGPYLSEGQLVTPIPPPKAAPSALPNLTATTVTVNTPETLNAGSAGISANAGHPATVMATTAAPTT